MKETESLIRLFKGVLVEDNDKRKVDWDINKRTIKHGFILDQRIVGNYTKAELNFIISTISKEHGLVPEKLNNAFHKDWDKVADANTVQLVVEQAMHYLTTYGYEMCGIYDEKSIFIPNEKMKIPEIGVGFDLVVIKGYTRDEAKQKFLKILNSGVALKSKTMEDIITIAETIGIGAEDINKIRNKEVKVRLADKLNIPLTTPSEFLRYVIYLATDESLLIKNDDTINKIKYGAGVGLTRGKVAGAFFEYIRKHTIRPLAEVFYRFKPIFLAFKHAIPELRTIINQIRRKAKKWHKPLGEDYLNTITGKIRNGVYINIDKLNDSLANVNTFRLTRLLYALSYRMHGRENYLYRIRNGKSFAKKRQPKKELWENEYARIYSFVLGSLVTRIKNNIEGKKIYIPDNIKYALPSSEKQFTGDIPSGSYVTLPESIVAGIHWKDVMVGNTYKKTRVDLDLSLLAAGGKFGWDANWRSQNRKVLFSGDMTAASGENGAAEAFYVREKEDYNFLVMVNHYNRDIDIDVPYTIYVGKGDRYFPRKKKLSSRIDNIIKERKYIIDPNNVKVKVNSIIDDNQKMIGMLSNRNEERKFYFVETNIGNSISSGFLDYVKIARQYLIDYYSNLLTLNDVLEMAGAEIIDDKNYADIDLSLENIERDSILSLLS